MQILGAQLQTMFVEKCKQGTWNWNCEKCVQFADLNVIVLATAKSMFSNQKILPDKKRNLLLTVNNLKYYTYSCVT